MIIVQILVLWFVLSLVAVAAYNVAKHRYIRRTERERQWRSRDGAS
jgi:hypothetical protein